MDVPKEDTVDRFELPADITALDNEQLNELLTAAVANFDEGSAADSITQDELAQLRGLAESIKTIRAEIKTREDAARDALAELNQLKSEVTGEAPTAEGEEPNGGEGEPTEPMPEGEPEAEPTEPDGGETKGEPVPDGEHETVEPQLVTASAPSASGRRELNLAAVRAMQPPQKLPEKVKDKVVITAAADVPGVPLAAEIDLDQLTQGVIARANGLKAGQRPGSAMVASYHIPFPENLVVDDAQNSAAGTSAVIAAADQSRLPGGDLVASGGWCAPSEIIYDIADVACPDMLFSLPEVRLARGGVRYFQTPALSISDLTWVHTEANDIAGDTKPCFHVPCADPLEVRCAAYGVCIEAGILTERFFPELVGWYVRNSMVAHEIAISRAAYLGAKNASTHESIGETMGAFSAVFAAIALHVADLIEKHSLCETTSVEVVLPFWVKNAFLADIARQNAREMDEIDPQVIANAFATLGVKLSWARGLAPDVPTSIGGTHPAGAWPSTVGALIYPTGAFELGRGPEVNLGAVYDSTKFQVNDYTALFTEECVALLPRGPESRYLTIPICPDGMTGAQITNLDCPLEAGTIVS